MSDLLSIIHYPKYDTPHLAQDPLYREALLELYPKASDRLAFDLRGPFTATIARVGRNNVGIALAIASQGLVVAVYVQPAYRRKGIALALLRRLTQGWRKVAGEWMNPNGIALAHRAGFSPGFASRQVFPSSVSSAQRSAADFERQATEERWSALRRAQKV